MKPSDRIHQIAKEQQAARVAYDGSYVLDAAAIVAYLDEQHAHAARQVIGETEHGDKVYGYAPDVNEPEMEGGAP